MATHGRTGGRRNSDKLIRGGPRKGIFFDRRSPKSGGGGIRGTPRRLMPVDRRSFF